MDFVVLDKAAGRRGMRELKARLKARRFDVVLQMQDSLRASRIALMTRSRRRVGFDRARARDFQWLFTSERIAHQPRQHVMEGLFGFVEHLGIGRPAEPRWGFPLSAHDRETARALAPDAPFCVMSPLSSQRRGTFRNWPAAQYAQVAKYIVETLGGRVLLTGSGSALERQYAAEIAAQPGVSDLNGLTNLKQLAALLGLSRIVVCPDSGPAHIAAAMGARVVGLYAGSNPDRSGPWGNREFVVNRYPEALKRLLGKRVDEVRFGRRLRRGNAMKEVSTTDVIQAVEKAWEVPGPDLRGAS